ncbi:MAG: hypothetical protein LBB98_05230 [Treponema sp.]|nr:hypothetical protein [Treponema sp.]
MSKAELGKPALIQGAIDGVYAVREAAKRLEVSNRRVKQLKHQMREQGEGTVIHGNAGKHPANYRHRTTEAAHHLETKQPV